MQQTAQLAEPTVRSRLVGIRVWVALPGLVALILGCYQLSLPHVLTGELGYNVGYDDGVYMGAALRFIHGWVPYRDFVIVHPPGIVYLLSPVALLSRLIGDPAALAVARCLTVVVTAANASLAGYVLRGRGRVAVAVAGLTMALWPLTVAADRTVELEPYLVFFCLLGAVALFDGTTLSSGRRLLWSGVWFGFALDVKAWAVLPIAAAIVCLGPSRRLVRFAVGFAASVAVVCVPFLALAPRAFVHDVLVAQLSRHNSGPPTELGERARLLTGVAGLPGARESVALAVALLVVLLAGIVWCYGVHRRQRVRLEWFALASWVVTVVGMFVSSGFFDHYAYLPAAFLALVIGVVAVCTADDVRRWRRAQPRVLTGVVRLVTVAALVVAAALVVEQVRFARTYLSETSDPGARIAAVIPPGACALSDFPTDLILAKRYIPRDRTCPQVVDPFGLYLAMDGGTSPHLSPPDFRPQFQRQWTTWLEQADYVEMRIPYTNFIPWSQDMVKWFSDNYTLVAHFHTSYARPFIDREKDEYVYVRNGAR